jgi:hypothetical protein
MIKQIALSQAAKTLALCVCPVVTAGVVATKVPQVRRAVHKATAPKVAARPERKRAALSNVALPPCTPVAPFATLPRVAAALPAGIGFPEQPGLVPTAASTPEARGAAFNPGFGAPGAFIPGPGGSIGGGGGGGGGIIPPGGGSVITPPGSGGTTPASPPSGVPEPETWLQVLAGFAFAGGAIRYYRVRSKAKVDPQIA